MRLQRIGVLSAGKTAAVIYGIMGLIFGAIFSLVAMAGAAFGGGDEPAIIGALFGVGAIIIMPLFYGFIGFIAWMIGAALYNLTVRFTGGIELDLSDS